MNSNMTTTTKTEKQDINCLLLAANLPLFAIGSYKVSSFFLILN